MKNKVLFIIISLMLFLTSCVHNPHPSGRTYHSTEITYSEPTAQYAFMVNMDSTETELAKYFFESNIDGKEREVCIEATEKVLSTQVLENTIPEIYFFLRTDMTTN